MNRLIFIFLSIIFLTMIDNNLSAKNDRRAPAAPPPPNDARFFGTYYGSFSGQICKKYRVKILFYTSGVKKKCKNINVRNIRLHIDYQETTWGGLLNGRGTGIIDGVEIPVAVVGKIVKKGVAWGKVSIIINKLRTESGYVHLSNDGLEITIPIPILKTKMVLRKDAGANTAPQVKITSPSASNRLSLEYGSTNVFSATVADAQQKTIPTQRLIWKSDRDGVFVEKGATVFSNSLSPGKHKITFEAVDDGGLRGSDVISIMVVNHAPDNPKIVQPLTRDKLYTSSPILFQGKAYDFEDGWLTGKALTWTSNKEGFMGYGGNMTAALKTPGEHIIRLTATDWNKLSNYAERAIVLTEYAGNSPPQVSIDKPEILYGIAVESGKEITFSGSAKDIEDPFNNLKLEWRISQATGGFNLAPKVFGTSDKVSYRFVSLSGVTTYVVTFAAKDSGNLEGQASIKIVVMPWTIK